MIAVYGGYLLLGLFQLAATWEGLKYIGLHWIVAAPMALFIAYIPLLGTVAGVLGAVYGWGWHWVEALALFFGPMAVIFVIAIPVIFLSGREPR